MQNMENIYTKKVLIVLSAADHWTLTDGTLYPTGYWAEEFVETHKELVEAGMEVDIATPGSVKPTVDKKRRLNLCFEELGQDSL